MARWFWLRTMAIAVAIAGVIDPVVTVEDRQKPEISLTADERLPDSALVERVADAIGAGFTIVRGPTIGAAASVHIGNQLPDRTARRISPAFAIVPEPRAPWVRIEAIDAPSRAHLHSRVPIAVHVRAVAARGRTATVTLESGGVAIDRAAREIVSDDDRQLVPLTLVGGVATGTVPLVVRAQVGSEAGGVTSWARADFGIDVRDRRWAVLAFDRRPSWMSTFVRRAIEADPRFVVTSRIVTSRGASVEAGRAPASLTELPSLALFDAVLAGAPEELSDAEVTALEAFMRHRGGAVVLLPDEPVDRRPYQRLLGPAPWRFIERAEAAGEPRASVFFTPDPDQPDVIWRAAVGSGRLVVSTALDSWRFRGAETGAFDRFWRLVVAEAADATPPPLEIIPDRLVLAPGEATTARIHGGPAAHVEVVRVRPSVDAGPEAVVATRDGARASATVIVVPDAKLPTPDERSLLETWCVSHAGQLLPESRLGELRPALERAVGRSAQPVQWFPMRSPWWIAPFALALSAEWWGRRRRGMR